MPFYDEMADIVQELLAPEDDDGLGQGAVLLKRVTTADPENEWEEPVETVQTWLLRAVVRRVSTKYVDGTLILATVNQVTFAVPAVVQAMMDLMTIDGKEPHHEGPATSVGRRDCCGLHRVHSGIGDRNARIHSVRHFWLLGLLRHGNHPRAGSESVCRGNPRHCDHHPQQQRQHPVARKAWCGLGCRLGLAATLRPILECAEIVDVLVTHVFQHLAAEC